MNLAMKENKSPNSLDSKIYINIQFYSLTPSLNCMPR